MDRWPLRSSLRHRGILRTYPISRFIFNKSFSRNKNILFIIRPEGKVNKNYSNANAIITSHRIQVYFNRPKQIVLNGKFLFQANTIRTKKHLKLRIKRSQFFTNRVLLFFFADSNQTKMSWSHSLASGLKSPPDKSIETHFLTSYLLSH